MPSSHLLLCRPPLFLPPILPFSFPMSQLFAWGGQNIGVSASTSVLPMNNQDWSPLGWTGWISLQSKGLSRVFSNTTVQKHQFFKDSNNNTAWRSIRCKQISAYCHGAQVLDKQSSSKKQSYKQNISRNYMGEANSGKVMRMTALACVFKRGCFMRWHQSWFLHGKVSGRQLPGKASMFRGRDKLDLLEALNRLTQGGCYNIGSERWAEII